MITDPHQPRREKFKATATDFAKSSGDTALSLAQFITAALAVFCLIPTVFGIFLGYGFNTILSGSMEPTFSKGDMVVTRAPLGADLQVGQVVGITDGSTRYTHRVTEVHQDGTATTKGDGNDSDDLFKPTQEDLWGVAVHVIPAPLSTAIVLFSINIDWLSQAFTTITTGGDLQTLAPGAPWGAFGLIVGILLAWWIIPDLVSAAERRRERRESGESEASESEHQDDIPLDAATVADSSN